jgi:hypothetical protein
MEGSAYDYPILLGTAAAAEPLLAVIAGLVAANGVDPRAAVLADFFQDDGAIWFGLLATREGRVFQFDYDYLHRPIMEGTLTEWRELTDSWTNSPYREEVAAALKLAQPAA